MTSKFLELASTIGKQFGFTLELLTVEGVPSNGSTVDSERANLCRMANALSTASIRIGNHGPGMVNMIFLPLDSAIIELTLENRFDY